MDKNKLKFLLFMLEESESQKEEIQIIPTIDVMMFLLVFFVLYTLNVIPMFEQSLALPSTKSAQQGQQKEPFKIYVAKDGKLSTDKGPTTKESIVSLIRENRTSINSVLIVADREASVQTLLGVLDILRLEGIKNVSVASERE
ncbi:MAG: biopolymer transporter ExbD [Aquificaceae bacterium]|nr:biopolymer transporter ExbD [Aquificaceae bacterium]MDW8237868.1 biopolymer transporter ExbD [Aquificaceae bacterium]